MRGGRCPPWSIGGPCLRLRGAQSGRLGRAGGVQLEVKTCFTPLLRWVLAWWESTELTLTTGLHLVGTRKAETLVALVVSMVYQGVALFVVWCLKPGGQLGPRMPALKALLDPTRLSTLMVRVLCNRVLQNSGLWAASAVRVGISTCATTGT